MIQFDRFHGGIDARLFWRWDAPRLVTGFAENDQRDNRYGLNNCTGTVSSQPLGVTGALRKDEDDRAGTRDVCAQAEVDLAPTLSATAGLSHGELSITSSDKLPDNGDSSGTLDNVCVHAAGACAAMAALGRLERLRWRRPWLRDGDADRVVA